MKKIITNSPEESKKIAQDFVKEILDRKRAEDGALVLALTGELGSGKTTFAQNFAEAFGIKEKIKSPTFIIMRKHEIRNPKSETNLKSQTQKIKTKLKHLFHFDVYRIHDEKEVLNLGWEEIIKNPENIVLVEWADKIEKILPKSYVKINFKHLVGNKREIEIKFDRISHMIYY